MAKRSPILGYNHNVRYRGLVFHVQTEDSGLLSPHLFTHLFHGGVIISTRKLVYDAGAAEEAIKSLMQAQHKAVLKDLKKGSFDEKIDQYLVGTPGLLPRGSEDSIEDRSTEPQMARASAPVIATPPAGTPQVTAPARPDTDVDAAYDLARPGAPVAPARTKTAERASAPSAVRSNLPPPPPAIEELGGPTLDDNEAASVAAAIAAANATVRTRMPTNDSTIPVEMPPEYSPLEIELELDEPEEPPRPRQTDITTAELELGLPGARPTPKRPGESVPPLPAAPHAHPRASSSVGAAALPPKAAAVSPARLPSRQAITPPQVVSRPVASADRRNDDAVEVYAPPPPGADAPPGAASERPGQYSQHKKISQKVPVIRERSGAVSVPPGLGRPGSARPGSISSSPSTGVPKPVGRDSSSSSAKSPARETGGTPVLSNHVSAREPSSGAQRARTPTPTRLAPPTRAGSSSGGVVMTRPAVIVGAPAKPPQPARVRKAREDEGRGFGQGLISEKSLDEVILAYLSEDADEK